MKREIQISSYDKEKRTMSEEYCIDNSKVMIKYVKKTKKIAIAANKEGFLYLASLFASFAEEDVPTDFELFLDSKSRNLCGELEDQSNDVVIFKYKD